MYNNHKCRRKCSRFTVSFKNIQRNIHTTVLVLGGGRRLWQHWERIKSLPPPPKKKETFTTSLLSGPCHKLSLHRNKKLQAFRELPCYSQSQINSYEIVLVCKISIKAGQQCRAILYNKWKVIHRQRLSCVWSYLRSTTISFQMNWRPSMCVYIYYETRDIAINWLKTHLTESINSCKFTYRSY